MPAELEDRIREAGREPRTEPDLDVLWRSGRTARRRQIASRGAAGLASVAVVAAVAVTQLPGDGVELADSPEGADDSQEVPETGPPGEPPEGGHNPAVNPAEGFFIDDTYGTVEVELPDLPDGLAPDEPRTLLFPDTEVVAYQTAFGEVDGPRLQALVYVGINADLDAALDEHEDSEEITLRGRRAVLDGGDEPAVAWQHEPDAVLAVHGMGGVTTDEVLAAAESLAINRGDLRAAVASHSAQIRAWHREQDSHPESPERNGDSVTFEGGSGDLRWTAKVTPATTGGVCWNFESPRTGRNGSCTGLEKGQGLRVSLMVDGQEDAALYSTIVSPEAAEIRYRFEDGETETGEILDAGGEANLALLLTTKHGPDVLLVEALDSDGNVVDGYQPPSLPGPYDHVPEEVMAVPPSPLPLSQFELWSKRLERIRAQALEQAEDLEQERRRALEQAEDS